MELNFVNIGVLVMQSPLYRNKPTLVYYTLPLLNIDVSDWHVNSNSNSTFIALNLRQKTDSKAHHTKTLFNIQKPETLQGSAPRRKQKGDWKFRVGMLFQRGMTSSLT